MGANLAQIGIKPLGEKKKKERKGKKSVVGCQGSCAMQHCQLWLHTDVTYAFYSFIERKGAPFMSIIKSAVRCKWILPPTSNPPILLHPPLFPHSHLYLFPSISHLHFQVPPTHTLFSQHLIISHPHPFFYNSAPLSPSLPSIHFTPISPCPFSPLSSPELFVLTCVETLYPVLFN